MCTFKIRHEFTTKNMCKLPPLFGLYIKYYCLKYFKRCKVRYALSVFKCHLTKGYCNFVVVIKILFGGRVESIKSPLFGAIFLCYWITYIVSVRFKEDLKIEFKKPLESFYHREKSIWIWHWNADYYQLFKIWAISFWMTR